MKRLSRSLGAGALAFAIASLAPARAYALATFEFMNADQPGIGFNDPTPAAPVGGNTGTTVGEQRVIAFNYALDIWAEVLESEVPIVVAAIFDPIEFECVNNFAPLGHAGSFSIEFMVPGADPNLIMSEALADQIAGYDLAPGYPDIEAAFNGGIADCIPGYDWYYGLDATSPRNTANLVQVVLHEIAHGLGFTTFVDPETGLQPYSGLAEDLADPYTMRLLDVATDKHWHEMTPEERVTSASSLRGLVWDGQYANDAARAVLLPGMAHITTVPEIPGFRDMLITGNFGRPLGAAITGPVAAPMPMPAAPDQCADPVSGVSGAIAISPGDLCHPLNIGYSAEEAGALATLITTPNMPPENFDIPVEDLADIPVNITALGIQEDDAALLLSTTGVIVTLTANMDQRNGTDPEGRLYMYSSSPIRGSSTASHFEPVARPDLTMEPAESTNPTHDITVDRALLRDIGWKTLCGNGMPDAGEECDNGPTNSDTVADACRTTCRRAACGDGVIDTGETCDPGPGGTDPMCTPTCTRPVCGNGMVEGDEECDSGAANSNTAPNTCRTTCENPSCGDGVVDSGEACDDALTPATCRLCVVLMTGTGGSAGSGAAGGSAGNVGTSGAGGTDTDPPKKKGGGDDDDDGGCGCRVAGSHPTSSAYALLLAALAFRLRRKRAT